jgi:hypothetical protein
MHFPSFVATLATVFLGRYGVQADQLHFREGVGVPFTHALDYAQLKREGMDHVRLVVRFRVEYPGQNRPPVISIDMPPVVQEIKAAQHAGLGVILATEATAQENQKLFYRNVAIDRSGHVGIRSDEDISRFDHAYKQVAAALRSLDSRLLMWEIFPEPGWAFRDTGPSDIVHNVHGGHDTDMEEIVKEQLGSHPSQRLLAARILEEFQDHVVPMIRDIWPDGTLMLGTPGYGSPTGPGVYQDCNPSRYPNTVFNFHSYGPRQFTHQGDRGAPSMGLSWPEPNWRSKASGLGAQQLKDMAYEFDNRPWNVSGLASMMDEIKAWQRRYPGSVIHFAEFGCTASTRDSEAGRAYIRDMVRLMDERGFGHTEWRG